MYFATPTKTAIYAMSVANGSTSTERRRSRLWREGTPRAIEYAMPSVLMIRWLDDKRYVPASVDMRKNMSNVGSGPILAISADAIGLNSSKPLWSNM